MKRLSISSFQVKALQLGYLSKPKLIEFLDITEKLYEVFVERKVILKNKRSYSIIHNLLMLFFRIPTDSI